MGKQTGGTKEEAGRDALDEYVDLLAGSLGDNDDRSLPAAEYRRLYEGLLGSLAVYESRMGLQQRRLDDLRAGLVSAIKRQFGSQVRDYEAHYGVQVSQLNDEDLLRLVERFMDQEA